MIEWRAKKGRAAFPAGAGFGFPSVHESVRQTASLENRVGNFQCVRVVTRDRGRAMHLDVMTPRRMGACWGSGRRWSGLSATLSHFASCLHCSVWCSRVAQVCCKFRTDGLSTVLAGLWGVPCFALCFARGLASDFLAASFAKLAKPAPPSRARCCVFAAVLGEGPLLCLVLGMSA